ncbi:hypothetical protein [Fredinandcohnia sp. 179-A 10B2 NHS]|uniref:hypothetical protein n=1 Tax=Fredinandcohnia sp. 179-A 10B2 NHS TaxID=3235176 RepID=UPI00399F85E5
MFLLLAIVLATIVGYLLLMLGPWFGGVLAFGIVVGCLIKGLYLLQDISKRLEKIAPRDDRVKVAYDEYIEQREIN